MWKNDLLHSESLLPSELFVSVCVFEGVREGGETGVRREGWGKSDEDGRRSERRWSDQTNENKRGIKSWWGETKEVGDTGMGR